MLCGEVSSRVESSSCIPNTRNEWSGGERPTTVHPMLFFKALVGSANPVLQARGRAAYESVLSVVLQG